MANDLSNFTPEVWSRAIQIWKRKMLVAKEIASFKEQAGLSYGDTVHRPYSSDLVVNDYTKGTAVSLQDINSTDETMLIDRSKEVSFYIDKLDKIQNKYDAQLTYTQKAAYELANEMDQTLLQETKNASYYMDGGDVSGGTPGTPISVAAANVIEVFSVAKALMHTQNIEAIDPWVAVVTPLIASKIEQSVATNGFSTADTTLKNGYAGDFMGLKVYVSNNVLHSNLLTLAGQPTANDTVTIGGVVFTFKASAAVAGEVTIGVSAAATAQNLVNAINNSGTGFVAVSTANRNILKRIRATAVLSGTQDVLVYTNGATSHAEAGWNTSWGTEQARLLFCKKGAIDMVTQLEPEVQINKVDDKSGHNIIVLDLYAVKSFQEGKDRMYDVRVVA